MVRAPGPEIALATGAAARLTGPIGERAVVMVNGGRRREVPGDWSATLEWLATRLSPRLPEVAFLEVRYRIKSWQRLGDCIEDCAAALGLAAAQGAKECVLLGFSMGGAVSIASAAHPLVSGVVGLAPWIPKRLDVSGLDGKRLSVIHGSLDGKLPLIAPGVAPAQTLAGVERVRNRGVPVSHTVLSGGVHGIALRFPSGRLIPLPRAGRWTGLVEDELRRHLSGSVAVPAGLRSAD
jgi:pimeloyl-ACP methyl ester carboxylesterase